MPFSKDVDSKSNSDPTVSPRLFRYECFLTARPIISIMELSRRHCCDVLFSGQDTTADYGGYNSRLWITMVCHHSRPSKSTTSSGKVSSCLFIKLLNLLIGASIVRSSSCKPKKTGPWTFREGDLVLIQARRGSQTLFGTPAPKLGEPCFLWFGLQELKE